MKKFVVIVLLFVCGNQQFGMLRPALPLLNQKINLFKDTFLRLASSRHTPIQELCLFSQVPLETAIENKIFQLKVEEEVQVSVLVTKEVFEKQREMFFDMQKEDCAVGILPDGYKAIGWKEESSLDDEFSYLEIVNPKKRKSFLMAALISYHSQQNDFFHSNKDAAVNPSRTNAAVFGDLDEMYCMQNNLEEFEALKRRFTELFLKSDY